MIKSKLNVIKGKNYFNIKKIHFIFKEKSLRTNFFFIRKTLVVDNLANDQQIF